MLKIKTKSAAFMMLNNKIMYADITGTSPAMRELILTKKYNGYRSTLFALC